MKSLAEEFAYRKYVNTRKALMIDGIEVLAKVEQFEELEAAQRRRQWKQRAAKTESISEILLKVGDLAEKNFRTAITRARLLAR